MSTRLFIAQAQFSQVNTLAGSGVVPRYTYTVPTGKRAILTLSHCRINGNAGGAGLVAAQINATIGGVGTEIIYLDGSGSANAIALSVASSIDLESGDSVVANSLNFSAVAVFITLSSCIREYQ